jgi:hypothetical protein
MKGQLHILELPVEILTLILALAFDERRLMLIRTCKKFRDTILSHVCRPTRSNGSDFGMQWSIENGFFEYFSQWRKSDPEWIPSDDTVRVFFESKREVRWIREMLEGPQVHPDRFLKEIKDDFADKFIDTLRVLVDDPRSKPSLCLEAACSIKDWSTAERFIKHPRVSTGDLLDALYRVTEEENVDLMKLLVSMPQVVERITPMWFSCGGLEALRFALSVDVPPQAANLEEALKDAAKWVNGKGVRLLAKDNRMTSGPHWNEAFLNSRSVEALRFFLNDARVDPTTDNSAIFGQLIHGAKYSCQSVQPQLQVLLQDGRADPSGHNNWALREAADGRMADAVQELLTDSRVDPNKALESAYLSLDAGSFFALVEDSRVDKTCPRIVDMIHSFMNRKKQKILGEYQMDEFFDNF